MLFSEKLAVSAIGVEKGCLALPLNVKPIPVLDLNIIIDWMFDSARKRFDFLL